MRISDEITVSGRPLSSTLIREMTENGEVEKILGFENSFVKNARFSLTTPNKSDTLRSQKGFALLLGVPQG